MKRIVLLLFFFAGAPGAGAQIDWSKYSQSFHEEDHISFIVVIRAANNSFWDREGNSDLFYQAKTDSVLSSDFRNMIARATYDTSKVHFFVKGIDRSNADRYEFRVLEYPSKHELVPWKKIDQFSTEAVNRQSGMPSMAYVGGYKTDLNNMIIVQVKELTDHVAIADAMVAWKQIRPRVTGVYTNENLGAFLKRLQYPWIAEKRNQKNTDLDTPLPAGDNNVVVLLNANIYQKEQVQYRLTRNGKIEVEWRDNDFDNSFVWLEQDSPGKYVLSVRYTAQPDNTTDVKFEIAPRWYQTLAFHVVMTVLGFALLGGIVLLALYFRQRNQNQRTLLHRNKLQLELKGIYAQWNPHFVFNALGSIQGLINRNDLKGANRYLADFARLMRESLTRGERESVSVAEELQSLEAYVKLEQLRFGFQFMVDVDDGIDIYSTDIPSQLLQPLVENAIKHGVSTQPATGSIHIQFIRRENNLLILITDNGPGFKPGEPLTGFGLKMTRERIVLLNQVNSSQPIALDIQSDLNSGTRITLTFNHWFL